VPEVSVIIPAYNAERYLRETLESVLAQTYRDFEVIVVDDGSTDRTGAIAAGFGPPVRCIRQANAGPSPARNRGIREARGALIAFLDADDLWLPEKLAEQVPLFDPSASLGAGPQGSVGLVYCHAERMDAEGRPLPTPEARKPTGRVLEDFLFRNHCPTSAAVVRRECLERVGGFAEDYIWAEDWHLWLRLARHYAFAAVPRVLVRHRVHPSALTVQAENAYFGARRVLETALTEGDGAALRAARRRGLHRLDRNQALGWLGAGEPRKARRCLAAAFRSRPLDPHLWLGFVASLLPGAARRQVLGLWKRVAPWVPWDRSGRPGELLAELQRREN